MDLLALRLAAGGGSINGVASAALVAAGFTLLQRSAPLVRALDGQRAGILLPPSPQFLVALAAAEGRGALLLRVRSVARADALRELRVGVLFTLRAAASHLPAGTASVFLDDAPRSATVLLPGEAERTVDLGSHFPLTLEGDATVPGRDEECLLSEQHGRWLSLTHRELLERGRAAAGEPGDGERIVRPGTSWAGVEKLLSTGIGPLLAGAHLRTAALAKILASPPSARGS